MRGPSTRLDVRADQSVVEQQHGARAARRAAAPCSRGRRACRRRARTPRRGRTPAPGVELDLAVRELADADLRSLQVRHDGRPRGRASARTRARGARARCDRPAMPCEKLRRTTSTPAASMRDRTSRRAARRPERGDDLGVARHDAGPCMCRCDRRMLRQFARANAMLTRVLPTASQPLRARLQHRHRRQRLAFEELEEGAAAGRDVADPVRDAELRDGGERVAAAGDRERRRLRRSPRAIALVPPANASNSNTPTGPFQTIVPARAMIVLQRRHRSSGRCRGSGRRARRSRSAFSVGVARLP